MSRMPVSNSRAFMFGMEHIWKVLNFLIFLRRFQTCWEPNAMVVRLFWDGSNTLWAVSKCSACGEVHKFLADEALLGPMRCKSCGQDVDLREHVRGLIDARQIVPPLAAD
jgi:hypothetical protein